MPNTGQKLNKVLSQDDLQAIGEVVYGIVDKQVATLATKKDLKEEINASEIRLKAYMNQGFESVMDGIDRIAEQLAEKEKVEKLMEWAKRAGEKIGVKVHI